MRRILHKLDVIRYCDQKLNEKKEFLKAKQKWLIPKTHPRGILGVDSPLLNENQSTLYKQMIQENTKLQNKKNYIQNLRNQGNYYYF